MPKDHHHGSSSSHTHELQEEFHNENVRKIQDLHKYDCLRANKSTMAWGVEARVPFLDRHFLDVAMSIDPAGACCTNLLALSQAPAFVVSNMVPLPAVG